MKNSTKYSVFILSALISTGAHSHTTWINGDPVPPYVKEACCGPSDAHHLKPEQVHVVSGGFKIDGYHDVVEQSKLTPSPDGEWWIFYKTYTDGSQSPVYCLFGPGFGV